MTEEVDVAEAAGLAAWPDLALLSGPITPLLRRHLQDAAFYDMQLRYPRPFTGHKPCGLTSIVPTIVSAISRGRSTPASRRPSLHDCKGPAT